MKWDCFSAWGGGGSIAGFWPEWGRSDCRVSGGRPTGAFLVPTPYLELNSRYFPGFPCIFFDFPGIVSTHFQTIFRFCLCYCYLQGNYYESLLSFSYQGKKAREKQWIMESLPKNLLFKISLKRIILFIHGKNFSISWNRNRNREPWNRNWNRNREKISRCHIPGLNTAIKTKSRLI